MIKQASIYCSNKLTAEYDMPKKGTDKHYRAENGRSVKVIFKQTKVILCVFFEKDQIKSEYSKLYSTLQESADAILAWNEAFRIY